MPSDPEGSVPTTSEPTTAEPTTSDPEALRKDIEATRQQLADTVDALSYKADVRARAQDKARELREQLAETGRRAKTEALNRVPHTPEEARGQARQLGGRVRERPAWVVGAVVVLIGLLLLGRRRGKRATTRAEQCR